VAGHGGVTTASARHGQAGFAHGGFRSGGARSRCPPWNLIATHAPRLEANFYQQIITPVNLHNRTTVYVQAIFSTKGAEQYVRIDEAELECD
jgi:hypothetical protein